MSVWAEVLRDRTLGREESLGMARGLEALHMAFALTGGLVRVLGTVIEIAMLAMFHPWKDLALGRSVALGVPPVSLFDFPPVFPSRRIC
jgi:hypothetical protein